MVCVALGVHARPDLLHQVPGVIVKFGGGGQRAPVLRRAGVRQFLAQRDAVGLAVNGFVDRRLLRRRLGRTAGTAVSKRINASERVAAFIMVSVAFGKD